MTAPHSMPSAESSVHGTAQPVRLESMWLPFAMPLLIGPPSLLAMGTLDLEWIGVGVTVVGTFFVTRDNVHSQSAKRRNALALGLALLFCASWVAVAWCAVAALVVLFPEFVVD